MIRFAHPQYFMYLFILPVLAGVFWYIWLLKRKRVAAYGVQDNMFRMAPGYSRVKFWLRAGFLLIAAGFLILAFANPQIGTKFEEVTRTGIDLIVAVDVSNSMNAEDIKPNRISAAKRELMSLINNLKGDRIGIIVFAGDAYTQLPLTTDYNAALMLTDIIYTGSAPMPGTAIGSAIELARKSFAKDEGKNKALVIITDGENHEDDPIAAAKDAAKDNIVIHTIGMGSLEGAPIPTGAPDQGGGFKTDAEGKTIISKLDAETLEQIAAATGGTFTHAINEKNNLATVFSNIEKMQKREFGTKQFTNYEDRFQWPLGAALLLLIGELFLSEKRNRFLARFSIFATPSDKTR